jgi:hypothetical protein
MSEPNEQWLAAGPPRRTRKRHLGPVIALIALAMCAWLYVQPYLVLGHIRSAAMKGDQDALAQSVDFPAVRENLKASMNADMLKSMQSSLQDNPFSGLGLLFGSALVDRMVDAYVTPSGIAMLTQGEHPDPTAEGAPQSSPELDRTVKVKQGYKSASVFHVSVQSDTSQAAMITFVLRRRGFSWMLADIRMPMLDASSAATTGQ